MNSIRYALATFCFAATVALTSGCDAVRTTSQLLELKVVDSHSQKPVEGVRVSIKISLEPHATLTKKHQREFWDQIPWSNAVTNDEGRATVEVVETRIDKTRGANPPPIRDTFTGHTYIFRIGEDATNIGVMKVTKGAKVSVGAVEVSVLDIDSPTYVATPHDE